MLSFDRMLMKYELVMANGFSDRAEVFRFKARIFMISLFPLVAHAARELVPCQQMSLLFWQALQ